MNPRLVPVGTSLGFISVAASLNLGCHHYYRYAWPLVRQNLIGAALFSKWLLIRRAWKRLLRGMSKPASQLRSCIPLRYQLNSTGDGEEFTTDAGERYVVYFSDVLAYFPGLAVAPHAFMLGFVR